MTDKEDPRKAPMKEEELARANTINGEVRISLNAYHELVASSTRAERNAESYELAKQAISKYMTFLRSKEGFPFEEIMNEFNKENPNLTMYIKDDGKVGFNLNLTS